MTRTDTITDELRTDILSGVFPPGDRLVERRSFRLHAVGDFAMIEIIDATEYDLYGKVVKS